VTYAAKIEKAEAALDWKKSAAELERQVRAFHPFPVATAVIKGTPLKIWRAQATAGLGEPGKVLAVDERGITVACGQEALRLTELQKPGSRRLGADDFLRGFSLLPGDGFVRAD